MPDEAKEKLQKEENPLFEQVADNIYQAIMRFQIIRLQDFVKENYPDSFDQVSGIQITNTHPTKFICVYTGELRDRIYAPSLITDNITDFLLDQEEAEDAAGFLKHVNKKEVPQLVHEMTPNVEAEKERKVTDESENNSVGR